MGYAGLSTAESPGGGNRGPAQEVQRHAAARPPARAPPDQPRRAGQPLATPPPPPPPPPLPGATTNAAPAAAPARLPAGEPIEQAYLRAVQTVAGAAGPSPVYLCPNAGCGETFTHPLALKKHLTVHYTDRRYACTIPGCTARYPWRSSLKAHRTWHSRKRSESANRAAAGHALAHAHHPTAHLPPGPQPSNRPPLACVAPRAAPTPAASDPQDHIAGATYPPPPPPMLPLQQQHPHWNAQAYVQAEAQTQVYAQYQSQLNHLRQQHEQQQIQHQLQQHMLQQNLLQQLHLQQQESPLDASGQLTPHLPPHLPPMHVQNAADELLHVSCEPPPPSSTVLPSTSWTGPDPLPPPRNDSMEALHLHFLHELSCGDYFLRLLGRQPVSFQ